MRSATISDEASVQTLSMQKDVPEARLPAPVPAEEGSGAEVPPYPSRAFSRTSFYQCHQEYDLDQRRRTAYRQARRQGLRHEDAQDTAARLVLEVLRQERIGTQASHDIAYLNYASKRFVRRDAADTARHARREICFSAGDYADPATLETQAADMIALADLTWNGVSTSAFWEALLQAVAHLPLPQRQAFLWRHVDEEAVPTIAARLERTEDATRQLLHRARLSLRAPLAPWAEKLLYFFLFFTVTKPLLTAPYIVGSTKSRTQHSPRTTHIRMVRYRSRAGASSRSTKNGA